jgi:prolyl 4-hydroxylase
MPCGPRILTFLLYLNDVAAGGGTNFPRLSNLTIAPKRGRAVLWSNVLDANPLIQDHRTVHQALPVTGTKFAANAWIHTYDYVTAQRAGCIAKKKRRQ